MRVQFYCTRQTVWQPLSTRKRIRETIVLSRLYLEHWAGICKFSYVFSADVVGKSQGPQRGRGRSFVSSRWYFLSWAYGFGYTYSKSNLGQNMANIMLYSKACKLLKGQRAVVEIQLCGLLLNNVHAHFSNNFSRIQSPLNFLLIELFIKKTWSLRKKIATKAKTKSNNLKTQASTQQLNWPIKSLVSCFWLSELTSYQSRLPFNFPSPLHSPAPF